MQGVLGLDTLIGLRVSEAEDRLAPFGLTIREVVIDGVGQIITADFRTDRMDVETEGGRIVRIC